jgi:hypothetical protein
MYQSRRGGAPEGRPQHPCLGTRTRPRVIGGPDLIPAPTRAPLAGIAPYSGLWWYALAQLMTATVRYGWRRETRPR